MRGAVLRGRLHLPLLSARKFGTALHPVSISPWPWRHYCKSSTSSSTWIAMLGLVTASLCRDWCRFAPRMGPGSSRCAWLAA